MKVLKSSKVNTFFVAMLMVMAIFLYCSSQVQAAPNGDFTYNVTAGEAKIIGYTGAGGVVAIPSTLDGVPVTSIGDWAFAHCTSLTTISIPTGVTNIGNYAFYNCTGLTAITINSATTAIYGYSSIPAATKIIGYDPSTAKDYATSYYREFEVIDPTNTLQSITITSPATKLRYSTGDTLDITGLVVTGTYGDGNTRAESITVANVTGFNSVVAASDQVLTITVSGMIVTYKVNILDANVNPDYTYTVTDGEAQITKYTGVGGVVTVPSTLGGAPVTSIGDDAFANCTGLTSISIPPGVTSIGDWAFKGCTDLTSINLPQGIISIGDWALSGTGLTSISLPPGVTSIGAYAFSECKDLTSIIIPQGVTSIGNSSFSFCYHLTSISLPPGITSIGDRAFYDCNLTSISLPPEVTSIGAYAFYETALTGINLPPEVTSIGAYAFSECRDLTTISIPQGVTSIGAYAFYGCYGLTTISIPQGVTSIGAYVFAECYGLTTISLPPGITSIGERAFEGCTGLNSIGIPQGVTSIGDGAFMGCTGLTSISLPQGVTSISAYAFFGCTGLTSISIPQGVTSIGDFAFYYCTGLTSISIPQGVTSLGHGTFMGCTGLTTIRFNSATTPIYGDYSTIPATTTIIGYDPSTAKDYATFYNRKFEVIAGSVDNISTIRVSSNSQIIIVADFNTKQPIAGAVVSIADKSVTTKSDGSAEFVDIAGENLSLSIIKQGYCDYLSNFYGYMTLGRVDVIYIRKDLDPGKPYISSISLNDGSNIYDLLRVAKVYTEITKDEDITTKDYSTIQIQANWKDKIPSKYILSQNGSSILESETGVFDKVAVGRKFKPGYKIYALIKSEDGEVSKPVEAKIQVISPPIKGSVFGSSSPELRR